MSWQNVLLTDSGFFDPFDLRRPLSPIVERFAQMLGKPSPQARVLFIPAAACDDESRQLAEILRQELEWLGFLPGHIIPYELDGSLGEAEALSFDVMFFTGGWCEHLLKQIKATHFDQVIKKFVFSNKVYVGVSAGSVIATPNIMGCFGGAEDEETAGLGLVPAYIDCHCNLKPDLAPKPLPLPHILLHFNQALAVSSSGFELLEDRQACHAIDWASPPEFGVDVFQPVS